MCAAPAWAVSGDGVTPTTYLATREAIARQWVLDDAASLRRAARALTAIRIGRPFDTIERRVPDYTNWVYGWMSSVWVSVELLGIGTSAAGRQLARGDQVDTAEITREMEAFVVDAFERQVMLPELAARDLADGWTSAVENLRDLDRRLADDRARRGAPAELAQPMLADWAPTAPAILEPGPDAVLFANTQNDQAHADVVLRRSVRPLSIRLLSAATRLIILPAVVPVAGGAVSVPLLEAGGVLGAVAMSGAFAAGLWGTDYALNWVDSSWHRPGFERELRDAVRGQRDRTVDGVRDHLIASFCGGRARLPDC